MTILKITGSKTRFQVDSIDDYKLIADALLAHMVGNEDFADAMLTAVLTHADVTGQMEKIFQVIEAAKAAEQNN